MWSLKTMLYTLMLAHLPHGAHDYCSQLSGTWTGRYKDHGAYHSTIPLTVQLHISATGELIGHTKDTPLFPQHMIYGSCENNHVRFHVLQPHTQKACGPLIQTTLQQPKVMTMTFAWENAMSEGAGPLRLVQKNKVASLSTDELGTHYNPADIKSCH